MSGQPSSVCLAPGDMPRIDPGPYKTYALVMTILVPFILAAQLGFFIYNRRYYVFLRKRFLPSVIQIFVGATFMWGVTVMYDYVGADKYPCWLFQFLNYFSIPLIAAGYLLHSATYNSEISVRRLRRRLADNPNNDYSKEALKALDNRQGRLKRWDIVRGLMAHLRLVFKARTTKARRAKDQLLHIRFVRSPWYPIFWMTIICSPFFVAYIARLATNPQWQQCHGCPVTVFDDSLLAACTGMGNIVSEFSHRYQISQLDSLRIFREAKISWRTGALAAILYIISAIDPGGLYAAHKFNWRSLVMLAVLVGTHIKTSHQVFMAMRLRRKLLTSTFVDREDRFEDVLKSKHLRALLRAHLDAELSSEIYRFMDDVEELRASWEREKEGRQARARHIFDTYIQKRAYMEINISSSIRDPLIIAFTRGNVDVIVFDEAYTHIKHHLLADGFARFLEKLNSMQILEERAGKGRMSQLSSKSRVSDLHFLASSPAASTASVDHEYT